MKQTDENLNKWYVTTVVPLMCGSSLESGVDAGLLWRCTICGCYNAKERCPKCGTLFMNGEWEEGSGVSTCKEVLDRWIMAHQELLVPDLS